MACYGLGTVKGIEFKSQVEFIAWLRKAHFPVPLLFGVVPGVDKVIEAIGTDRGTAAEYAV